MANSKKTTDTKSTSKKRLSLHSLQKEVHDLHELNLNRIFSVKSDQKQKEERLEKFIEESIHNHLLSQLNSINKVYSAKLDNFNSLPWYTRWAHWAREMGYLFFNPEAVIKLRNFRLFTTYKY